jgi:hypothetical protein
VPDWISPSWCASVQPSHHFWRFLKPGVLILRYLAVGNPNSITVLDDVLTTGLCWERQGVSMFVRKENF